MQQVYLGAAIVVLKLHFYLPPVGRFFVVEDVGKVILQIVLLVGWWVLISIHNTFIEARTSVDGL